MGTRDRIEPGQLNDEVERWHAAYDIAHDQASANGAALLRAHEMLREAAERFREYERNHRAKIGNIVSKDNTDSAAKAERNAEIAARIEALLEERP